MAVEQEPVRTGIVREAGEDALVLPAHRDRLPVRATERGRESIVFAAMELQQVRLQRFDDVLDIAARVVHHQRDHRDLLRYQVAQHARLAEQQPARAVRREHQAHVVHAQLHRQADVLGAGQPAELDARMHGGKDLSGVAEA